MTDALLALLCSGQHVSSSGWGVFHGLLGNMGGGLPGYWRMVDTELVMGVYVCVRGYGDDE